MDESIIIDGEVELEPLPKIPAAGGKCLARVGQKRRYCQKSSMENGRCYWHGGKSLKGAAHGRYIDGRTSKYQYLPPQMTARYEQLTGNSIDNLEDSIGMQKVLETQIAERMRTGESETAWKGLIGVIKQVNDEISAAENPTVNFETELKADAFETMSQIVRDGSKAYAVQKELRKDMQSIHDSQRKLTESLTKCRKEVQETYTQEQWNELLNRVLLVVKDSVTREQLAIIGEKLGAMQTGRQLTP